MTRKELFELFLKHSKDLNLDLVDTNRIFRHKEELFRHAKQLRLPVTVDHTSQYLVYTSPEGIVFFLQYQVIVTGEEGPNNEAPSSFTQVSVNWCTRTSKLMSLSDSKTLYDIEEAFQLANTEAEQRLKKHIQYI